MTEINGSFISREILPSKFDTLMCNIWWLCRRIARKQTANISAYPCTLSTLIRMQTIKRRPFRHKKTKIHPTLSNCPFGPCTMMTNMMLRCIGSFTLLKLEDVEWFSASNWKKLICEYPQPYMIVLIVLDTDKSDQQCHEHWHGSSGLGRHSHLSPQIQIIQFWELYVIVILSKYSWKW